MFDKSYYNFHIGKIIILYYEGIYSTLYAIELQFFYRYAYIMICVKQKLLLENFTGKKLYEYTHKHTLNT